MEEAAVPLERGPTLIGQLEERRKQIQGEQSLPLVVPRWDNPQIWVSYRPADHGEIRSIQSRIERAPKKQRFTEEVNGNADLLVKCCKEIWAVLPGAYGERYSLNPDDPRGEYTRFDPDLARNLGLTEEATAREVCRKLFITDGDLIAHARKLMEWSGYTDEEADEGIEGE